MKSIYPPFYPAGFSGLSNVVGVGLAYDHGVVLINDGSPFVARKILNQTVSTGSTAMFLTGIVGGPSLSYQWQFNGTNMDGATNPVLTLTNVTFSDAGSYACVATNSYGAATNTPATLTVLASTLQFIREVFHSGAGFELDVNQLSGRGPVIIFGSTDLLDWSPLFTNPPVTGSLQFMDPAATNLPYRFYRAVEQ